MGTFNNFRSLQKHADKEIKFKQMILLQVANHMGVIEKDHYVSAKGGICASLVMSWLQQRMDCNVVTFNRGAGTSVVSQENVDTVASLVPSYVNYRTSEDELLKRQIALAREFGLRITKSFGHATFREWVIAAIKVLREELRPDFGVYVGANVSSGDAHAVGFHVDPDDRIRFFDPNIGEYLIFLDKEPDFFDAYHALVAEHMKWTYEAGRVVELEFALV